MLKLVESFTASIVQWVIPGFSLVPRSRRLGWVGGSGVVEEAPSTGPARTSCDHAEAMLHREWGGELQAPSLNASSLYGRGECVLLCAIVRSAANRFGWEVRGGRALVRCASTE